MIGAAQDPFPSGFDSVAPASGIDWFDRRRADALKRFRAGGIPHRRIEEWKYSDLRSALEVRKTSTVSPATAADPFDEIAGGRVTIRDGQFDACGSDSSLHSQIEVLDLAALRDDAPEWVVAHLGKVLSGGSVGQASFALMRGGVALRIGSGKATTLRLRFRQDEAAVHSRVLIVLEEGASLLLLESHDANYGLTNIGVEFVLGRGSRLRHVRLATMGPGAIHIEEIALRAARDARYCGHFSQTGARLARLELAIALDEAGAEVHLSGGAAIGGGRHVDITAHVEHNAGYTRSRQLFKYAVADHARAVYQGKVTVAKNAEGSDSRQTAKAILLGERAEADLKPELEILADDVKCAHGAAVGDLDSQSLFYLRARGIPESEARGLLLRAFLEETVAEIENDEVRRAAWGFIDAGISQRTEAQP